MSSFHLYLFFSVVFAPACMHCKFTGTTESQSGEASSETARRESYALNVTLLSHPPKTLKIQQRWRNKPRLSHRPTHLHGGSNPTAHRVGLLGVSPRSDHCQGMSAH